MAAQEGREALQARKAWHMLAENPAIGGNGLRIRYVGGRPREVMFNQDATRCYAMWMERGLLQSSMPL